MQNDRDLLAANPILSRRAALRACALSGGATLWPNSLGAADTTPKPPPPRPAAAEFKSTPLVEGITHITGAVCNIVVANGPDGAVVIDSGIPDAAAATAMQIAAVAPKVALLVNTHWHFDHAGGNEALARAGARIVAHENCRRRLASEQHNEFFDRKSPPSPPAALPVMTFASETRLHLNGEEFRLVPVPPAHTDGDVIVRLEKANVVHMGDLFFNGMYPFIDFSSGGWIGGMVEAVRAGLDLTDAKTQIVPGHGPVATQGEMKTFLAFLETMHERLARLKAAGTSVDEAVAAAPTKDFDEKLGGGFFKAESFVRFTYTGLLRRT